MAGLIYGFGFSAYFIGASGNQEMWETFFPQVTYAYMVGCALLGIVYWRFIENALLDEDRRGDIFYHDFTFTLLGTLGTIFLLFPTGHVGYIPALAAFAAGLVCVIRLASISSELKSPLPESGEQPGSAIRH